MAKSKSKSKGSSAKSRKSGSAKPASKKRSPGGKKRTGARTSAGAKSADRQRSATRNPQPPLAVIVQVRNMQTGDVVSESYVGFSTNKRGGFLIHPSMRTDDELAVMDHPSSYGVTHMKTGKLVATVGRPDVAMYIADQLVENAKDMETVLLSDDPEEVVRDGFPARAMEYLIDIQRMPDDTEAYPSYAYWLETAGAGRMRNPKATPLNAAIYATLGRILGGLGGTLAGIFVGGALGGLGGGVLGAMGGVAGTAMLGGAAIGAPIGGMIGGVVGTIWGTMRGVRMVYPGPEGTRPALGAVVGGLVPFPFTTAMGAYLFSPEDRMATNPMVHDRTVYALVEYMGRLFIVQIDLDDVHIISEFPLDAEMYALQMLHDLNMGYVGGEEILVINNPMKSSRKRMSASGLPTVKDLTAQAFDDEPRVKSVPRHDEQDMDDPAHDALRLREDVVYRGMVIPMDRPTSRRPRRNPGGFNSPWVPYHLRG